MIVTLSNDTMNVEQAVFASSDRGPIKGYQLVAKSAGVDRARAAILSRWAPTKLVDQNQAYWTLNSFRIDDDSFAISRTMWGGPEYSGRGGMQVVTVYLILTEEQFGSYGFDPIAVAKTSLAMGWLRLPWETNQDQLPLVALPSCPIVDPISSLTDVTEQGDETTLLDEASKLVGEARRVAIIGCDDPIRRADQLVSKLSPETRKGFSFTTGLTPSIHRPFQLHFLAVSRTLIQPMLDAQQIVCLRAR